MAAFMVECYWPGLTEPGVTALIDAIARVGREASTGDAVRYLMLIWMPSDEVVFCVCEASFEQSVRVWAADVGLRCDRISAAVITSALAGGASALIVGEPEPEFGS